MSLSTFKIDVKVFLDYSFVFSFKSKNYIIALTLACTNKRLTKVGDP